MTTHSRLGGDFDMRNQFVSALESFLEGSLQLGGLQRWILSNLQLLLDSGDSAVVESANALDAAIVDFGEELISQNDFVCQIEASIRMMRTFRLNTSATAFTETTATPTTLRLRRDSAPVLR